MTLMGEGLEVHTSSSGDARMARLNAAREPGEGGSLNHVSEAGITAACKQRGIPERAGLGQVSVGRICCPRGAGDA